jgi:hypothetical protein
MMGLDSTFASPENLNNKAGSNMKRYALFKRNLRLVWNLVLNIWFTVTSNGNSKVHERQTLLHKLIVISLALAFAPPAQAASTGGQVSAGTGTIAQAGTTTTIIHE